LRAQRGTQCSYQNREHRGHPYEEEQERLLVGRPAIRILEYDPGDYPR